MDPEGLPQKGTVYLVGAGPGDPGLLTLRGLELLEAADVVIYDRLVSAEVLALARTADLVNAGKGEGDHTLEQDEINDLLIKLARAGRKVCRLKGGDPFVFGRGGEEAARLAEAGIPFEVVPGVTSAIAGPAYAGIPVTHRGLASSFACVTAHEDPQKGQDAVDWSQVGRGADTLVILMGSKRVGVIARNLIDAGHPPTRPVAVIESATLPQQRVITGTLADIAQKARAAHIGSPSVIVVGEVVGLADKLNWLRRRRLNGVTVMVTRDEGGTGRLASALRALGAEVVGVAATRALPLEDESELSAELANLGTYQWAVFASANAAGHAFRKLNDLGLDARALAPCKIAAMGPGTAAALADRGIAADFIPERFYSGSLLEGLIPKLRPASRVAVFGALGGRAELVEGLRAAGHAVAHVAAYRSEPEQLDSNGLERLRAGRIDWVAFTSSSAVSRLVEAAGGSPAFAGCTQIACIGPTTAATAEGLGLRVARIATEHTLAGLVDCIVEATEARQGP